MRLVAASVAVILGLAGVFAAAEPAPKNTVEKRFAPADLRADLAELYARLAASHFDLFARRPKGAYDAHFQSLMTGLDRPLTVAEAGVTFQKFMAYGRVAHSRIEFPADAYGAYRDAGGRTMPVFIRLKGARVFVARNASPAPVTPGDEIMALNGAPIADWLARLGAHVSADNDYMLHTLLENRFAALLWLELGPVERFALTVRDARGAVREVSVPARTREEIKAAAAQAPPALELDWDARVFRMAGRVGYLRPGPFYNNDPDATNIWDTSKFRAFVDGAFDTLVKSKATALVIDLRDNPGGDNSFSDLLVAWYASKPFRFCREFRIRVSEAAIASNAKRVALAPNDKDSISAKLAAAYAKHRIGNVFAFDVPMVDPRPGVRFAGKVYLLINRHSYSNAVQVAALSQDYGFATIVGEETSDLATTIGAMEQFTLSRTGIAVGFPKAEIVRVNGDRRPRGVVPDIAIDTPVVEPPSDVVLQQALAIAGRP